VARYLVDTWTFKKI